MLKGGVMQQNTIGEAITFLIKVSEEWIEHPVPRPYFCAFWETYNSLHRALCDQLVKRRGSTLSPVGMRIKHLRRKLGSAQQGLYIELTEFVALLSGEHTLNVA